MRHVLLAALLLCPSALVAQTYVTAPPGFLSKSGRAWAWGPGAYANGRSQLADGTHRGKVMILKGMSFRMQSPTSGYWQPGRSFTKVTLDMSETRISGMTGTFSTNVLATPTRVFDKAWSLPWVTGPHQSVPAPWTIHFPFSKGYVHAGTRDMLADFAFSGGKLANNKPWTTQPIAYLLDAPGGTGSYANGLGRTMGNTHSFGCVDSGSVVSTLSARSLLTVTAYNPRDPFQTLAGRLRIEQSGISFGANATAVTAFGFRPNATGVAFPGVACNKIHVGLATPIVVATVRANAIGRVPAHYPATGSGGIPMSPAYVGVAVVTQGAWNDTKKGNLLLSAAAHTQIPALPPLYDLAAIHSPDRTSGRPTMDYRSNPIRRYTK